MIVDLKHVLPKGSNYLVSQNTPPLVVLENSRFRFNMSAVNQMDLENYGAVAVFFDEKKKILAGKFFKDKGYGLFKLTRVNVNSSKSFVISFSANNFRSTHGVKMTKAQVFNLTKVDNNPDFDFIADLSHLKTA